MNYKTCGYYYGTNFDENGYNILCKSGQSIILTIHFKNLLFR